MRPSQIISKWDQNQVALAVALHLRDASLFEMAGQMGFDGVWLDLEHRSHSVEAAADLIRAARAGGADVVARPGKEEFMVMGRLLEAGAAGIMYPRCSSAAEAREAARWAKFAPLGQRGFDGAGADSLYSQMPMQAYLKAANEQTFLLVQIEEPEALEQVESIAAVDGVDAIMLGPADFSLLSGHPGEFDHPCITDAFARVARAAMQAGKQWAATCSSAAQARRMIDMGARLVFHGCDLIFVKNGLEQVRNTFAAELGISFRNLSSAGRSYSEEQR